MLLPKTFAATPPWIAMQNPKHWLTDSEIAVWGAWNSEKRRSEWLAGRLAAKKLLREARDLAPRDWSVGRSGAAPVVTGCELPGISLSLSHSHGFGAATYSETQIEGSAGVDIQQVRPVRSGLCARVFTPDERKQIAAAFGAEDSADGMLLLWALKEAAIKARRQPWPHSLQSIQVQLDGPNFASVGMENEPRMTAQYERLGGHEKLGGWWLARVVRPAAQSASDKESLPDVAVKD